MVQCQTWEIEELSHCVHLGLSFLPSEDFHISVQYCFERHPCQRIKGERQFHWLELRSILPLNLLPLSHALPCTHVFSEFIGAEGDEFDRPGASHLLVSFLLQTSLV